MRILIGCEFSATVREAFKAKGHDAWSCDLLPSSVPGQHLQCDIFEALERHFWDRIILHPPCTAIALSGNRHYGKNKPLHEQRLKSLEWTRQLWQLAIASCNEVVLENPKNVLWRAIGKHSQVIHPWQYGHPEQKQTWLWVHGLPLLKPTKDVYHEMMLLPRCKRERMFFMGRSSDRGLKRSITFQGIADAMANQWG